jgi:hypothetical protein
MQINTLCPHCDCTTTRDHVPACSQRESNSAPHPAAPPPSTPVVPGSLWVWQTTYASAGRSGTWVLWGAIDRNAVAAYLRLRLHQGR